MKLCKACSAVSAATHTTATLVLDPLARHGILVFTLLLLLTRLASIAALLRGRAVGLLVAVVARLLRAIVTVSKRAASRDTRARARRARSPAAAIGCSCCPCWLALAWPLVPTMCVAAVGAASPTPPQQ